MTINKVCGSGLKAVMLAAQAIKAGDGDLFVAGGMESMSNAPYLLTKARTGYRMGDAHAGGFGGPRRALVRLRAHPHGRGGRDRRRDSTTSRARRRTQLAYHSHMKAHAATEAGRFRDEIVPVEIPGKKGATR